MDRIEHVTVRWAGQGGRTPAEHLRVERLLGLVEYQPPGLPSGVVLVVQRLDGLPPITDLSRLDLRWESAVKQRIHDLYRRAARPAGGAVDPTHPAVLFTDAAEMLVCYTRDVLARRTAWYWPRLFPQQIGPPGVLLAAAYIDQAAALPPTLRALAPREVTAALVQMHPAEIRQVVRALHAAYHMLDSALPETTPVDMPLAQSTRPPAAMPTTPPSPAPPTHPAAPWSALPAAAESLAPQAVYLWGLAVTLRRRPAWARSPEFAAQAARWLENAATQHVTPATRTRAESPPMAGQTPDITAVQPVSPVSDAASDALMPDLPAPQAAPDPDVEPLSPAAPVLPDGLFTGLGGALYLIHVLAWFDLPPDVNRWDALAALAWALLENPDDWRDDALWAWLAETSNPRPHPPAPFSPGRRGRPHPPAPSPYTGRGGESVGGGEVSPVDGGDLEGVLAWQLSEQGSEVRAMLPPDLLFVPGRIVTSQTHIDLYLPLWAARVDVRQMGLDASPGWVPDLGYIVMFHFIEQVEAR